MTAGVALNAADAPNQVDATVQLGELARWVHGEVEPMARPAREPSSTKENP
jgi:hypothetical protein